VLKAGKGTLVLGGNNSTVGIMYVGAGVLRVTNSAGLGNTANGTNVQGGAALELANNITIGAETLSLNGAGISNGGALRNLSGANSWAGAITIGASGARINSDAGSLTLTGGIATTIIQDVTFGGAGNTTVSTAAISGSGSVIKDGAGTLTLSAANTYSGATFVEGGTMVVEESLGNSAVSVSNLGTILATDAAAAFGGTVTINNEAIFAVGGNGSAGTATIAGNTTFKNGSIFSWDINNNGTAYDKVVGPSLSGELTEGDAIFRIVVEDSGFTNGFWATDQTWTDIFMVDGTNPIANWADLFSVAVVDSDLDPLSTDSFGTFSVDGNTLTWTAIPEPTTALGGLLLGAGLLRRRRGEKV
jgi:autotransporter-associated beta strand protein